MTTDYISVNGVLCTPAEASATLRAGYVRQDIRVAERHPVHIAAHIDLMCRTFERLYGIRPVLSPAMVSAWCSQLLAANRCATGNCIISAILVPVERDGVPCADLRLFSRETLLDAKYVVRPLRLRAAVASYQLPYEDLPTSFAFEAAEAALLRVHGSGCRTVLRTDDEGVVLSAGTSALFAIEERRIITTPQVFGAPDSVERRIAVDAIIRSGAEFSEEIINVEDLDRYDELFYCDCRGLTSIEQCGRTHYMSLIVDRIADLMR